jgi:iron complex transport system permease protein
VPLTRLTVRRSEPFAVVAAVAVLMITCVFALVVGAAGLGFGEVIRTFGDWIPGLHPGHTLQGIDRTVLFQIRLPRVALAALVGGALAVAGASFQGVFRNPLVDPYLLGTASGAGLAATVVLSYSSAISGWPVNPLPAAAFIGALGAVAISGLLATAVGGTGTEFGTGVPSSALLLAGIAVASFLTSIQTFVQQRRSETLRLVYAWILGGLTTAGWGEVRLVLPYVLISFFVLIVLSRALDVMAVGDEEARSLGVSPARVRIAVVLFASLATAAAVSVAGLIGFVGLIVPHAVRALVGQKSRTVLIVSFFIGSAFLVGADAVARTVISPAELPVGVITAFVGAPVFAAILIRQHRRRV